MPMERRSRPKRRLVLDIGSSAVRLCELTRTKTGYQLVKYYQREFPVEPSMDEGEQGNQRLETLKTLLKDAKVRSKRAVFGVPGQSVFVRPRTLPPVPEHKVSQIVRYEIQQQIPFSLDQIAFDYQVLRRTEAGGFDVLMAAIKADVVDKQVEIIQKAKRAIDTVDVCPFAAYNWLKRAGEFGEEGECIALLDLGATTTDIVIEREGQFRFQRSLNIGGNDITAAVSAEFGVPWVEAEKLKRERGFAPTGDPRRDGKGGEVIGRALGRLISEINRSFSYFRSQPGGAAVSRIIVTGGGACLRNIIPYLQKQLGLEVRIAQPLAGLAISPVAQEVNDHPEQAAVVLGLALRCWEPVPVAINLTPPRILHALRRRQQLVGWGGCVAIFAVIMASMVPAWMRKNEADLKNMETAKNVVRSYDPKMAMMPGRPKDWKESTFKQQLIDAQDEIDRDRMRIHLLDEAYKNRRQRDWVKYMALISDLRPKGKLVALSSFESIRMVPVIQGAVVPQGGSSYDDDEEDEEEGGGSPGIQVNPGAGRGLGPEAGAGGGIAARMAAAMRAGGAVTPGLPGGAAAAPAVAPGEVLGFDVATFPGISGGMSGRNVGGSGGMSFRKGRDDDEEDEEEGGGFASSPTRTRSSEGGPAEVYNGIRIQGFAEDAEVLRDFVTALEDSGEFVEGGVVFNSAYSKRVPISALDAAGSVLGSGGAGRVGRLGDRTSGFGTRGRSVDPAYAAAMAGSSVMTFQIDLQFMKAAPQIVAGGGRRGAGGVGGSTASRDKLRERKGE